MLTKLQNNMEHDSLMTEVMEPDDLGLGMRAPQMKSSILYPTPSELTTNYETSKTTLFSLASFLHQWMNGYITFDESCLVTGTLYLTVDGRQNEEYSLNEKLLKSEGETVNVLSNSYHTQNIIEVSSNIWTLEGGTLQIPEEKETIIKIKDFSSLNDPDVSEANANVSTVSVSHSPDASLASTSNNDMTKEGEEKFFVCGECGKGFTDRKRLVCHKRSHRPPNWTAICTDCERTFPRKRDLLNHTCGVQQTNEKYACRFCSIAFVQLRSLKRHMLTHTEEAPFKCDTCGKTFITPATYKLHQGIHTGEVPYGCEICGRGYISKSSLMTHMWTHSKNEKSYVCELCGRSYFGAARLLEHMRTHKDLTKSDHDDATDGGQVTAAEVSVEEEPRIKKEPGIKMEPSQSDHLYANPASLSLSINPCTVCTPDGETITGVLDELLVMLPNSYKYLLCKAEPQYIIDSEFTTQFAINIKSKEEIKSWLEEFSNVSKTTFCIGKTRTNKTGEKVIFKQYLYCQHGCQRGNGEKKKKRYKLKKTGCEVKISVALNSCNEFNLSNPHHSTYPTTVQLNWGHNHTLEDSLLYQL